MIDIYALAKNPLVFQKQRTITSAYIDVSGKMGIAQTVLMVQDNFTENFGAIKQDNFCVHEKGAYWVIYKAKFKFFQRPFWRDKVVTTSFPADNAPIRTYENTAITTLEGEPIILAVQEACCLVEVYRQKVLPQHIDMSHHMNNIEYVKLALNVFSSEDLELCIPSMLEVHFMGETHEGQEVKVFRADKMGATYMKIEDDEGRQVFEMKIKMK